MRWLLFVPLVIAAGCIEAAPGALSFSPGQGSCSAGEIGFDASRSGGVISFSGSIGTPNPCYSLSAGHSVSNGVVQVMVSADPKEGVCIQCLGHVPFNGTVSGLEEREYSFIIVQEDKVLFEKKV